MKELLVLTIGQTDVQLVLDGVRRELRKDRCAVLHDEIELRSPAWRIVDTPVGKGEPVEQLPAGELLLCTPKLDAVLREFSPSAALLLETRRDANCAPSDPRFAGAVLEMKLIKKGVPHVRRRAYLEGSERLEDPRVPRDAVIRQDVVRRLEQAVSDALGEFKPARVVMAATGGFPVVGDLLEEIVRLHAVEQDVEILEIADGSTAVPPTVDRAVRRGTVPDPLVSFRARRRALELVTKGNLLGAWAVVEPLHAFEAERRWTQVIEWLARFASSLPMPDRCEIPVLTHKRMAVRAALRVELALRAGDIPRAVHGTVAFFEAAVWDHLLDRFDRTNPAQRGSVVLRLKLGAPEPVGPKLLRNDEPDEKNKRNCPFERLSDGTYLFYEDGAGRFARYYVQSESLKKLADAVVGIRYLRNDVAHNEPTPGLMEEARCRMQEAGLWSPNDSFLAQPAVRNVLNELGIQYPVGLCDELIETVRQRLVKPDAPAAIDGVENAGAGTGRRLP
ncbi:MAG TPA: hypothetical protein VNL96_00110 [Gemmatimonadaceae bacterium]|nr:hypothetical protein [Gemmatimonadaceae bacterium]